MFILPDLKIITIMRGLIIVLIFVGVTTAAWNCWHDCGNKSGPCHHCGDGGRCCRINWYDGVCPSFDGCDNYHCCNLGDCWHHCGGRGGPCSQCKDSRKACCRKGWSADPFECGMGLKGCNNYHCCVNQATEAEVCGGKIDRNWKLLDIKYDVSRGFVSELPPKVAGNQFINNSGGSTEQEMTFVATEEHTETKSFTHTAGASVMVGTEFKTGVPVIAEGKVKVEVTLSYEFSYGKETSVTKSKTAEYTCKAPAGNIYSSTKSRLMIFSDTYTYS